MLSAADRFGRREAGGLAVDLYWTSFGIEDEFVVEVNDERNGTRFALYPATGREAIQAFYHPSSAN